MAPLRPLNHWMIQDDRLAREFDGALGLTPYYDPVRLSGIRSEISFFASLTGNVNSPVGQIAGDFQRNSHGTYRPALGFYLQSAGDDVSRHDYSQDGQALGLLMEPATTNVCLNYNANPDEALTGITRSGPGTITREDMTDLLAQSGLDRLCTSGYAIRVDGTNGSTDALVSGFAPNVNGTHGLSAYVYCEQGDGFLAISGGGGTAIPFSQNKKFERVAGINTLSGLGGTFFVRSTPGSIVYFVLNHLEEASAPSSVIVTEGAATSRAVDRLTYPTVDSAGNPIINQTEGMHAITWRPQFDRLEGVLGSQRLTSVDTAWLSYDNQANAFVARSGTSADALSVLAEPLAHGKDYVVAVHWSGAEFAVGHKADGAWVWSAPLAYSGINDAGTLTIYDLINNTLEVPGNSRNVYIWRKDEGQSWLEQLFAGVAN